MASWVIFMLWRQHFFQVSFYKIIIPHQLLYFWLSFLYVPIAWVLLFYLTGAYRDIYQKSRLVEGLHTLAISCIGVICFLFFVSLFQNGYPGAAYIYKTFLVFTCAHFIITFTGRIVILNIARYQLMTGKVKYNTLIIGANQNAIQLYKDISQHKAGLGYHISGFIYANAFGKNGLASYLPNFGTVDKLEEIIDNNNIQQVILAVEKSEQHTTEKIISRLSEKDVIVRIIPDMYDIVAGTVRTSNVYDTMLIELKSNLMSEWQLLLKRLIDVTGSLCGIIFLSPVMLYVAVRIKLSSPGPIIYRQQRLGYKGKPFTILKFRSMYRDAETGTPLLSYDDDPRITSWGRIMRQWRLDELPQLWNILKGEMSFVGPRPERKYFISEIMKYNEYYRHLLKVKPGLTSWGMVKFGYAVNVKEMIERMRYDLIYLENISLALDLKIMIHTLLIILKKQGK